MSEILHQLYRPESFDQVIGQNAIIASLRKIIERRSSQAFLFCGPPNVPGIGKTTLCRITATELGCKWNDIIEVDGATFTGIDAMRGIQETLRYKPFGGSKHRAIIIDEVHRISSQAFDSLLKIVEEPPPHVLWFFATTNAFKVPQTIKTRCATFTLKPVKDNELHQFIEEVIAAEKIKLANGVATLIVNEAGGSPRQALVNLALCRDLKSRQEAAEVLKSALESEPTLELCQYILKGGTWTKAMSIVNKLKDENMEGVRINVCNYIAKALQNAKTDEQAARLLNILGEFSTSYQNSEGMPQLLLSVGRVLFSE